MSLLLFLKPHYRTRLSGLVRGAGGKKTKVVYHVEKDNGQLVAKPVNFFAFKELLEKQRAKEKKARQKKVENLALMKLMLERLI